MEKKIMDEKDKEILSLKRRLGGMETSNSNYRKTIQELKQEIKDVRIDMAVYKAKLLDLEKYKRVHELFMSAPWYVRLFCMKDFEIE